MSRRCRCRLVRRSGQRDDQAAVSAWTMNWPGEVAELGLPSHQRLTRDLSREVDDRLYTTWESLRSTPGRAWPAPVAGLSRGALRVERSPPPGVRLGQYRDVAELTRVAGWSSRVALDDPDAGRDGRCDRRRIGSTSAQGSEPAGSSTWPVRVPATRNRRRPSWPSGDRAGDDPARLGHRQTHPSTTSCRAGRVND